jgi:hypothetical protein
MRQASLNNLQQIRVSKGDNKEAAIIGKIATTEMRKAHWGELRNILNP